MCARPAGWSRFSPTVVLLAAGLLAACDDSDPARDGEGGGGGGDDGAGGAELVTSSVLAAGPSTGVTGTTSTVGSSSSTASSQSTTSSGGGAGAGDAVAPATCPVDGVVWAQCWGPAEDQAVRSVSVSATGAILVGGYLTTSIEIAGTSHGEGNAAFVTQLGPDGTPAWTQIFSGRSAAIWDVAATADGGVVVAGELIGSLDLPGLHVEGEAQLGGADMFVAKLDGAGDLVWLKHHGTTDTEVCADSEDEPCGLRASANAVAVDAAGNVLVVADFAGRIDFGTGALDAEEGGQVVLRLDADGEILWAAQSWGGPFGDIVVDAAGAPIVAGTFFDPAEDDADVVRKLDPETGATLWGMSREVPEGGWSVALDAGGDVLVGTADYQDGFVHRLDPTTGEVVWSQRIEAGIRPIGLASRGDGIVVVGTYRGQLGYGDEHLDSTGEVDLFALLVDGKGGLVESTHVGSVGREWAWEADFTADGHPVIGGDLLVDGDNDSDALVAELDF